MNGETAKPMNALDQLRKDFAQCWNQIPSKGIFFSLLAAWLALFHFLGNSTLGYTNTVSLLGWMDWTCSRSTDDEHGPFMLFVVLTLLWWKRQELLSVPKKTWWPALILVLLGLLCHLAGYVAFQQARMSLIGFFLGIYGLMGLVWGPRWLQATFFPFFLFAFCMPLGGTLADKITFPLRMLATKIATVSSHAVLGINVAQDGTRILSPDGSYQYEVAAACSGIRSLTATLALAMIYAFVMFKSSWRRVLMIASAFPLAVAANVFRLITIIFAAEMFGQATGNYVHESWWMSLLPYIPAMGGIVLMGRWLREKREVRPANPDSIPWTVRDFIVPMVVVGAAEVTRQTIPGAKVWFYDHPYTLSLFGGAGLFLFLWLPGKLQERRGDRKSEAAPVLAKLVTSQFLAVILILACTAAFLIYRQANQRLGPAGVKLVQQPVYDSEGKLVGTNRVDLPEQVLNYASKSMAISTNVTNWLPKDTTYGQRIYKAPDGFEVQMNVVLMGTDRTSIHKPQYCLEGAGWGIEKSETATILMHQPTEYPLPVMKITANHNLGDASGSQGTVRGIYVYWFVSESQLSADHDQRMLWMGLDMLRTGVLQRWAYVSCFAVCYPGEEEKTYARLKELIVASVPHFQLVASPARLARNP